MWKTWAVMGFVCAAIFVHVWPRTSGPMSALVSSAQQMPLTWMHSLIGAHDTFMNPILRIFGLKTSDDVDGADDGVFVPPKCLRNPMAEKALEKHRHLSLLGHVFDVSENGAVYGPKGMYAYMTGRDATRLVIADELKDDSVTQDKDKSGYALSGLKSSQLYELGDWLKFYSRKYKCVGYHPGIYLSPMGDASEYLLNLIDVWNREGVTETPDLAGLLPVCMPFFDGKALRLSCNAYASGDGDDEAIYPRQLLEPERATLRCACVPRSHLNLARLRRYPGCSADADYCSMKIDDAENVWTGRLSPIEAS